VRREEEEEEVLLIFIARSHVQARTSIEADFRVSPCASIARGIARACPLINPFVSSSLRNVVRHRERSKALESCDAPPHLFTIAGKYEDASPLRCRFRGYDAK